MSLIKAKMRSLRDKYYAKEYVEKETPKEESKGRVTSYRKKKKK